jgi:hypothetical protein
MDSVEDSRHEAALRHAENGYRVFPCPPRDKRPLTSNGFHDATTDADTIRAWAEKHPGCLWGTPDGLVLDVDTHEGGADGYTSYRELADVLGDGGGVPAETRSGGLHLWCERMRARSSASRYRGSLRRCVPAWPRYNKAARP